MSDAESLRAVVTGPMAAEGRKDGPPVETSVRDREMPLGSKVARVGAC